MALQAEEDGRVFSSWAENAWSLPEALSGGSRRTGRQAGLLECEGEDLGESAQRKATEILRSSKSIISQSGNSPKRQNN